MNQKIKLSLKEHRGTLALVLALCAFRATAMDWHPVPSGSMNPSVLEGDVVLVNRLAYNAVLPLTDVVLAPLGAPQRGDVVTFSSPVDGALLLKRVVGVPGDEVELRSGALFLNGQRVPYSNVQEPEGPAPVLGAVEQLGEVSHPVQWLPTRPNARDFGPVKVPEGHFFAMGDNRDNSLDSRYFGPVPVPLLQARVEGVLVSADITDAWQPRFARFGASLR